MRFPLIKMIMQCENPLCGYEKVRMTDDHGDLIECEINGCPECGQWVWEAGELDG